MASTLRLILITTCTDCKKAILPEQGFADVSAHIDFNNLFTRSAPQDVLYHWLHPQYRAC